MVAGPAILIQSTNHPEMVAAENALKGATVETNNEDEDLNDFVFSTNHFSAHTGHQV